MWQIAHGPVCGVWRQAIQAGYLLTGWMEGGGMWWIIAYIPTDSFDVVAQK